MSKILYDAETMKFSSMFEMLTQARLKDCFKEENAIVFVVQPGFMAKAIGKKGVNVRKIGQAIKKEVRLIEFSDNAPEFIKNALRMSNIDVEKDDDKIIIHTPDTKTKGQVYGREKERLQWLTGLVKRYFDIKEIIVD